MHRVAERIEDGGHVEIDGRIVVPDIGHRQRDVLGESAGAIDADAACVLAQMASPRQAIATQAAHHMALAADDLAGMKVGDVGAGGHDLADELMADDHRHGNGFPRPIVPFPDVDIGAANAGAHHADENIIDTDFRPRHVFEPQSRFRLAFDESLHARSPD